MLNLAVCLKCEKYYSDGFTWECKGTYQNDTMTFKNWFSEIPEFCPYALEQVVACGKASWWRTVICKTRMWSWDFFRLMLFVLFVVLFNPITFIVVFVELFIK